MRQFLKYILRGCLGGAIVPLLWLILFYGPLGFLVFVYRPGTLQYLLGPGALVGLIVWLCNSSFEYLGRLARVVIGSALLSAITLIGTSSAFPNGVMPPHFGQTLPWLTINSAIIGALSGLCCPAGMQVTREPKLTYWERVALYEMAELEAKSARQKTSWVGGRS